MSNAVRQDATAGFTQSIDACFGASGAGRGNFDRALEKTGAGLGQLRRWYDTSSLPLLRLPETVADRDGLGVREHHGARARGRRIRDQGGRERQPPPCCRRR